MELSTAMRFVMVRAQAEAASSGKVVFPEHVLLGILKFADMTAEEISSSSSHKAEMDKDIALLREEFSALGVDTGKAREKLRRVLQNEPPAGDGAALITRLLIRAGEAKDAATLLYPSHLLLVMKEEPSPTIKDILNLKGSARGKIEESGETKEDELTGLPFLAELAKRIRSMRYTLLDKVRGQDHAVHSFAEGIFSAEVLAAADTNRKRPRAIFVFAGPPGVGKTFLAEQAAEALKIPFKRFDMSGFSDEQSHIQLIGWAPSFKAAKKGLLTGFVKENPHSFLLFDEIEKASLNTIQLFLQILDAGRLHDDFLDEDIFFKDTIIIFTTNAGRQLYEGGNRYNAAGIARLTVLNALETDTHPQTRRPFFPAAICSRLATGYPIMFNHLAAHDLESISSGELERFCSLFKEQYGINAEFDEIVPAVLLFAEGGQTDARTLRAQSELFFKNEIFKLCRLWGENMSEALEKLTTIRFKAETEKLPEGISTLFKNIAKTEILIFGDPLIAAKLEEVPEFTVFCALERAEAFTILSKQDIRMVLLKLAGDANAGFDPMTTRISLDEPILGTVAAFDYIPMSAATLNESRLFFKNLRERIPEIPVYLLENEAFVIDTELLNAFVRAGARDKLLSTDISLLAEKVKRIAAQLYLQASSRLLHAEHKVLSFETAPVLSSDKTEAVIRLREFMLHRAADAADTPAVLDEVEKPQVRFTDVIGAEGAKEELVFFIQYLKNPKTFAAKGLKPPKGVLLYGPPGTGKTLLAKAMAGECGVAFIPAVASGFATKWQGSGPEAVRELFQRARRYAPSIVFIDEIDAIGRARGGGNAGHGEEMALNALLTEMDGFSADPKRPVFVLAATNFNVEEGKGGMGTIDAALARRFDRRILLDLPTKEDRRKYIEYLLAKRQGHTVSTEFIERLAERSTGLSPANLESIMELAARNAAKQNTEVNDEFLEDAFEVSRHGEQKDWGHDYLERVARHEAGHAYLCFLGGNTPSYLTIIARGSHGGYMEHADTENSPLQTKATLLSRIRTSLGGRAAELVYYGVEDGISTGAAGDLEGATRIAKAMIANYGMDEQFGLASLTREEAEKGGLSAEIQQRVNTILKEQMDEAILLIGKGKKNMDKLVSALLEKNKLTKEGIERILK
ncbi:MAG: AAA family ATPase [Deferribacteraceae bacterium]|jgi:ATP-dependent metalloprotease FtsH|nr:AAA family ATPase [Deferribacteraceae bacterium]